MSDKKEAVAAKEAPQPVRSRGVTRETRIPLDGNRDVLTVKGKDPNYKYRWVIDAPGRIERLKLAGYEVVTDDLEVGQLTVDRSTKVGSAMTKASGDGRTLVLMRIPKEWFDEDQRSKQARVDALEASMKAEAQSDRYGVLEIKRPPKVAK